MLRTICMVVLLGTGVAAMAADDLKVSQLEQDVRELQRQVLALSRQVESQRVAAAVGGDAARRAIDATRPAGATSTATPSAPMQLAAPAPAWVDAAKWQRIRHGMGELEVVGILGPPTSMRMQQADRVLFYAMEIGASGFLGGSVTLRDRSVASVQRPTLQ